MPLTLSIGLTEAVADDDAVTLIARADKALYQAKSDGRNCRQTSSPPTADQTATCQGLPEKAPSGRYDDSQPLKLVPSPVRVSRRNCLTLALSGALPALNPLAILTLGASLRERE